MEHFFRYDILIHQLFYTYISQKWTNIHRREGGVSVFDVKESDGNMWIPIF